MKKKDVSKKILIEKYIEQKKTLEQISIELGCSLSLIWSCMKYYGIKTRTRIENTLLNNSLAGKKIGKLLVIKNVGVNKSRQILWLCKCDCGNESVVRSTCLKGKLIKSCGCSKTEHLWKGYQEISGSYWSQIKKDAKRRNKKFNIKIEYAWNLLVSQNKKCALSGLYICLGKRGTKRTASLDRIDSSIGYEKGNVQWVHKDINKMKMDLDQERFINLCRKVSDNG